MEVEQYEGGGGKRKVAESVEKKIFIFMDADNGTVSAGIFEIDIEISTRLDDGEEKIIEAAEAEAKEIIKPIATFFEKIPPTGPSIPSVGVCVVGSDLYMIPDEREKECEPWYLDIPPPPVPDRILPIKFDLINKDTFHIPNFPIARKISPLVVALRNKVYALSSFDFSIQCLPEPCFESLNLNDYHWYESSLLPCCSPLHKEVSYAVTGYAVLEESFILVSLIRINSRQAFIYSYDIQTGKWKTVNIPPTKVGCQLYDSLIVGEAVVINNNIYSYHHHPPEKLVVFSYSNNVSKMGSDANNDILLGFSRVVEGSNFASGRNDIFFPFRQSSSLGKVDDGTLCVLHALYQDDLDRALHVSVSIIQLEESDRCNTLKSFCCRLGVGIQLVNPKITSCIVLDPKGTGDHRPSKRPAL